MKRTNFRALALLTTAILVSSAASAQGPREACKGDVQSFCSDVQPGGGRIIRCLKDHSDQLSDGCRTAMQNARQHAHGNGAGQPPPPPGDDNNPPPPPAHGGNDGPPPPQGDNGNGGGPMNDSGQ